MKVNGKDYPIYYENLWKIKNVSIHQPEKSPLFIHVDPYESIINPY